MRKLGWALLSACLLAAQAAGVASAAETITAFGLVGSWSFDCSKPIATCDKNGCGSRMIFEVSPSGRPLNRFVVGVTASGQSRTTDYDIHVATRIAADKIKIISTQRQPSVTLPWMRQAGERWETVLVKSGDKFRIFSARREDGQKVSVEEGFSVRPEKPDQVPTNWIRSAQETPWFQKCGATAETVAAADFVARSEATGYAVKFPIRPSVDVKNTPAGKVTINFARLGDNMFTASEAESILADTSTALDSSVTSLVKSFPVAIVMSKQSISVTAASGRALPAETFTFVNPDIYGEGIVVAAGRHLITVVAVDTSKKPTKDSDARLAIKKFVSSLKFE